MRVSLRATLAATVLLGCADAGVVAAPVVYGVDDRREVYQEPAGPHRTLAETSVAMQIGAGSLDTSDPDDVRITYERTLGEAQELCAGERFAEQIEPGTCSATLIDDRHLLTAGHCVETAEDCDGASYPWLFGFAYESAGRLAPRSQDDVYHCTRTVAYRNDDVADYAVIELDRPVVGHAPARLRASPALPAIGTPVTLIGHPNGIPMKIAHGGTIRDHLGADLVADVDAFSANSGSGVFDDAGELVGILVSGADDYTRVGGCFVVDVIDPVPPGEGENVTGVQVALDAFCATPGVRSSACGTPAEDAGAAVDGGVEPDASIVVDGGTAIGSDAGVPPVAIAGGCGCTVASRREPGVALMLLASLGALLRARRRR